MPPSNTGLGLTDSSLERGALRYFARLPLPTCRIRFPYAVLLTSYGFLQTLPLASSALAIRITFPSVGVVKASFSLLGLPASSCKQKKSHKGSFFQTALENSSLTRGAVSGTVQGLIRKISHQSRPAGCFRSQHPYLQAS